MNTSIDTRIIEEQLGLPDKIEEADLFADYDMVAVFDRYLPLADYLLDQYACPNDGVRMVVEETMYTALMMAISKFRRAGLYKKEDSFACFLVQILSEFMDEFAKEGKVYKIDHLQVMQ